MKIPAFLGIMTIAALLLLAGCPTEADDPAAETEEAATETKKGSGGGGGGGNNSGKNSGGAKTPEVPPPLPPPKLRTLSVTYDENNTTGVLCPKAVFTFDMSVDILSEENESYTMTGSGQAHTVTLVPEKAVPGVPITVEFTAANPKDRTKTLEVSETIMPVSAPFSRPISPTAYRVVYGDEYGAVGLVPLEGYGAMSRAASGEPLVQYCYVEDERCKSMFNAVYAPNAPFATDKVEPGKNPMPYTADLSSGVLRLFTVTVGDDERRDKIKITGTELPGRELSSGEYHPLIIDLGLPDKDNPDLPPFHLPVQEFGSKGQDYSYIRLRVNRGVNLQIDRPTPLADPPDYGNLTKGTVEIMGGGRLSDPVYEGFLGTDGVVIARIGSSLEVGSHSGFSDSGEGFLLVGSGAKIRWGVGDQNGSFIEIRKERLAFDVNLTIAASLTLKYSLWFINGPELTIAPSIQLSADGPDYRFYGTFFQTGGQNPARPAARITLKPLESGISKSFLTDGETDGEYISADSAETTIFNRGMVVEEGETPPEKVYYLDGNEMIYGFLNWELPQEQEMP
jgi:hypothetical protein